MEKGETKGLFQPNEFMIKRLMNCYGKKRREEAQGNNVKVL